MRLSFSLLTALALASLAAARAASAADVEAVLSSDSSHYRQAFEGFQEEWGSSVPAVVGEEVPRGKPDVIAAFGSLAALRDWPENALLVTCLAPGARPVRRGEVLRVELLPIPALLISRIRKLLPRLKVLRVFWASDYEEGEVGELITAARKQGVSVLSERISDPALLPGRLRSLSAPADALWLMPDPALVNEANFAILREYASAARVPFLAPTDGLAEKGATATVAATFRDVGRAAAAALRARLRGERTQDPVHPDRLVVTVNATAARAVGMDLKAAEGVDRTVP
ncbi:MAG: hypothetical protein KGJ84_06745 [Elusimicrobia bacterium]|nr:hypothetical protein [Elusimicrobiota bacterium]